MSGTRRHQKRLYNVAAAKQDGDMVKAKIGQIRAKCGACHAKIRDKK